ncbi:hypothetical protein PG990_009946 [Apiospora arundinis]
MIKDNGIELRTTTPTSGERAMETGQESHHKYYSDDETLRRLGKQPRLQRTFGFMSTLGVSCSALCTWESLLLTSVPGLVIIGPAGLTWALVFNWIGIMAVYAVMAELASIAPTSGGQYHWVAMLAPKRASNFLCYQTAWLTTLAWQAISCMVGYLIATLLQGIIALARPTYVALDWHTVLLIWAFGLLAAALNCTNSRLLASLEGLILILHLAGFFGVLIPMVYLSPHNDPSVVFTTFMNEGLWPTQGVAFMVGYPTVATALLGADCAVHLAEEIEHASTVVPQALMYTIFINGGLGLAIIIAMLFCMQSLPDALAAVDTVFYPALQIFYSATRSTTGACLMAGIVFVLSVAASVGIYASASRMMWSFARDKGLPFSGHLVKLTKNSLPLYTVCATLAFTVLLSLIILGSAVALQALCSLSVAALCGSYTLPCSLLLWRRLTGGIRPYLMEPVDPEQGFLTWGPWRVPEPVGTIINIFACMYGLLTFFWSFWPQTNPPTPETMNWSVLVFSSVMLFSIAWYFFRAREYFKGPIREV